MSKEKDNTARRDKRVDKLIRSIRQKVAKNELRFRAHNKINHLTAFELAEFMGVSETKKRVLTTLAFVSSVTIKKTEEFVVGQKFQHRKKDETGIQTYIWDSFRDRVLNPMRDRKVKLSKNRKLDKLRLLKDRHDTEMQAEVGHKPFKVAEFLPMLWSMLSEQKNGEEGFLLTNGCANIFHVELEDGSVVAVNAYWGGGEWGLGAFGLDFNPRWDADYCLFVPATM